MLKLLVVLGCVACTCPDAAQGGDGELALAPLAFVKFCSKLPEACEPRGSSSVAIEPDHSVLAKLQQVNQDVNAEIAPDESVLDPSVPQDWSVGPARGNCNDYAVTKQHALTSQGFPTSAVRLAAVVTADGQDHMVVVVKVRGGDLVLDNLVSEILPLRETGYRVTKEQSGRDPKLWIRSD